jgi:radical SAM-linked protein
LRLTFATAGPLAYVSVLDLGRIWERSLRRAAVPLKYSQGFNPRPRLQFAAPLPTGCEGEAEWLDLWLVEPWEPARLLAALQGQTPVGLTPLSAEPVPESAPALETQIVAAEYRLELYEVEPAAVQSAVEALLAAPTLPRERRGKPYDLRPLIEALSVEPSAVALPPSSFRLHPSSSPVVLLARLTARPGATGRPDELLAALGYADVPRRCTRVRLLLSHAT